MGVAACVASLVHREVCKHEPQPSHVVNPKHISLIELGPRALRTRPRPSSMAMDLEQGLEVEPSDMDMLPPPGVSGVWPLESGHNDHRVQSHGEPARFMGKAKAKATTPPAMRGAACVIFGRRCLADAPLRVALRHKVSPAV